MFIPFSRVVVLAVLYLSVLTNAVPVVDDGVELVASGLVEAEHDAQLVDLEARVRTPRPRPRPRPKPAKTIVRKPAPVKTIIRRPVPAKTPIRRPVPTRTPVKRPTPAKPTTPVKRPTAVPKPPVKPTKPVTPAKPPVKPTKTTSKTPTATPSKAPQCPINNKPTKGTKGPRALYEWAVGLFKRDSAEFIGWHGTNSNTAELWRSQGYLADPKTSGWPWSSGGRSGADHELGEGVYITDAIQTARGFANNNAAVNVGTAPMLCGIYARSSATWKSSLNKVWLPNNIIRDSSDPVKHLAYEKQRNEWIGRVIPHSTGRDVARFGPLDKNRGGGPNQVVIPSALTRYFYAVCVDARTGDVPIGANTHINFGTARHPWNVRDTPCR
ncbi:hypothetical protein AURDEDRAFT_117643 [Auricularia subglabra TFB-10046 SS5]|uniref:SCP domain-containing protein n=1 Tax=Auricularia subglabra (strain TFB-10046 / SS5) TaxID=717982 RepID=J0CVA5_AURST|nr:hypothetical protein AURDEDRAFT_117643 [Auricularia subglabra TFB-10046 SS5]